MKIGFVGLGKLGLPVALSIENSGHEVCGYDIKAEIKEYIENRSVPYEESGTPELLEKTNLKWKSTIKDVVASSEIVFCPVQTPHLPMYEGITRLPKEREDFNYIYLKRATQHIAKAAKDLKKTIVLVIISTVLPGTIERDVKPRLNSYVKLCYNPLFIAMGTTRKDFENPEFSLVGVDDEEAGNILENFYKTIHGKPVFKTDIKNAELIKVVYNTFISSKIAYITTIQEICHKTGADIDEISNALSLATDRIVSIKYMYGGMPDGGGCHPRDNIALSWLARKLGLKFDLFEAIMLQREKITEWYADLIEENRGNMEVVLCGVAFKKNINLLDGSPVILLDNILRERNIVSKIYDPVVTDSRLSPGVALYFIGMNHDVFKNQQFLEGSVVIDPWGIIKPKKGVKLIKIGRK